MSHIRLSIMEMLVEVGVSALGSGDVSSLGAGVLEVLRDRLGMVSGCFRVRRGESFELCSTCGSFSESLSSTRVPVSCEGQVMGELVFNAEACGSASEWRGFLDGMGRLLGARLAGLRDRSSQQESVAEEPVAGMLSEWTHQLLGQSGAMERLRKSVAAAVTFRGTVLLRGHGGTGKDLVARLLHRAWCGDGPWVSVGGAGVTESSLRQAVRSASGGVLYVDGVEGLSRKAQAGLLGLLRGGAVSDAVVRVIGSTSVDLESMVERGQFEGALYVELSGRGVFLPDLKDRRSDIMLLANHFIERFNRRYNRQIRRLSTPAINLLVAYHWPGNVRELENCMEHAVVSAMGDTIHGYNLPATLQLGGDDFRTSGAGVAEDFKTKVAAYERELIIGALKRSNGKLSGAAQELGISPRVIHYKIHLHGITPAWYKHDD